MWRGGMNRNTIFRLCVQSTWLCKFLEILALGIGKGGIASGLGYVMVAALQGSDSHKWG